MAELRTPRDVAECAPIPGRARAKDTPCWHQVCDTWHIVHVCIFCSYHHGNIVVSHSFSSPQERRASSACHCNVLIHLFTHWSACLSVCLVASWLPIFLVCFSYTCKHLYTCASPLLRPPQEQLAPPLPSTLLQESPTLTFALLHEPPTPTYLCPLSGAASPYLCSCPPSGAASPHVLQEQQSLLYSLQQTLLYSLC